MENHVKLCSQGLALMETRVLLNVSFIITFAVEHSHMC